LRVLGLYLTGLLLCGPAWSLQSDLTLQQLNHKGWTAASGAPSDVVALAQTADGTLWVGSEMGLFRFDGLTFVRYAGPAEQPFESNNVSALATSPGGELWIGFRFGGVGVLKDGHFTRYGETEGLPDGTVKSIVWDHDGVAWVATRGGLARLRGTRWERVAINGNDSLSPYGAFIDHAGSLWVLSPDRLLARAAGANQFRDMATRSYSPNSPYMALAAAPDGAMWTSDTAGLTRIDAITNPRRDRNLTLRSIAEGPLLFDHEGNLWLGGEAVRRLSSRQFEKHTLPGTVQAEAFGQTDGLTSTRVICLFEDREGNIWAGTTLGLDRFSNSNVVRLALPPALKSADPVGGPAIVPGDGNTLWVALRTTSPAGLLLQVRDGKVMAQQSAPEFSSGYRDTEGVVWFGGPAGLAHIKGTQLVTQALPEQARGSDVQAIVRDRAGAMWISVARKGLFRLADGQWLSYGGLQELPRRPPIVETADARDLWFGYTNNHVARLDGSVVRLYDVKDGLTVGNVTAIEARRAHVWIGGELGLARLDGNHFVPVHGAPDDSFTGITGIVETQSGDLWLNGNKGLFHLSPGEVEHAVRDADYRVQYEAFDYLDGLPGMAVQLRPVPSVVETPDGGLWFVTTNGLASIVSTRIRRNTLPPPVRIWSVTTGHRSYPITSGRQQLPVHTTQLQIEYTAGSLTIPERVHFRYKLEGLDSEWQDAGGRREAFYTNLAPGEYSFHVIAANNDGVWDASGASFTFTISPVFYQRTWFRTLCVLVFLILSWLLFDLRIRQIRAKARGRLEERLAERERIARDLHDTLLQGVQGLVLRFQAVANRIPKWEPARELMERALQRADQVLLEGRDRVMNLRAGVGDVGELVQALAAAGEQLALAHPAQFRTSTEGVPRALHPTVHDEIFFVVREALTNAFRHADATKIEAEVSYGKLVLTVRVRDDGRGIEADVLLGGRPGHWGLVGMRERARKIRANLDLWSKPGAGTEIELRLPAELAYRKKRHVAHRSWWRPAPSDSSEASHEAVTERRR
jgi:signal transduction histidine kinase/ligand-binding sensor domain-containing protein